MPAVDARFVPTDHLNVVPLDLLCQKLFQYVGVVASLFFVLRDTKNSTGQDLEQHLYTSARRKEALKCMYVFLLTDWGYRGMPNIRPEVVATYTDIMAVQKCHLSIAQQVLQRHCGCKCREHDRQSKAKIFEGLRGTCWHQLRGSDSGLLHLFQRRAAALCNSVVKES